MKLILRQAALTLASVAFLYSLMLGLSFIIGSPVPRGPTLDSGNAEGTLYRTTARYVFLSRYVLNTSTPKVVLIGASNVAVGFGQAAMQALVPCVAINSMALGNANISELRQIIDLIHDVQNGPARQSDTFVIGVWSGMFSDTETRWPGEDRPLGNTDIDNERYRYGFYRRTPNGPVPVLPPSWLQTGVTLIRPYLLFETIARDLTQSLRSQAFIRPPNLTDAERDARSFSNAEKQQALVYWRKQMGDAPAISRNQVAVLQDTIESLLSIGEKVVLVDLPIPTWHRDASPYTSSYKDEIETALFAHFAGRRGFAELKMPDLADNQDYSDEVHPKTYLAREWEHRLANILTPLVCGAKTASRTRDSGG